MVRVNKAVTADLVRMLNLRRATRGYNRSTMSRRLGGWELIKGHPQPCVQQRAELGDMWARIHVTRQLASQRHHQAPWAESPRTPRKKSKTAQEAPSANSTALRKVIDHRQQRRMPLEPLEQQELRMTWKGKPVSVTHRERDNNRKYEERQRAPNQPAYARAHPKRYESAPSTSGSHPWQACSR